MRHGQASGRPSLAAEVEATVWHRSPFAVRFIFVQYVPLLAAGNLIWEMLQLPFYTLWQEGDRGAMLFAVVHCTGGDVLIGTAALLSAVMLFGRVGWPRTGHARVVGAAALAGVAYTVWSEWVNTEITVGWEYAESMVRVPPFGTGLTPLLQWLIVPPVAYGAAWWLGRQRAAAAAAG